MLNTDKLRNALDIVLSARVIHAEVEKIKVQTHEICDPHLQITQRSARPTIDNPVDVAVELAMIDAAAGLSKECLEEIEKHSRSIAKTIAKFEVLVELGSTQVPSSVFDQIDDEFAECGLRIEEMEKVRAIAAGRWKNLESQI